ncbi:nuclear transport factor 2 family protein [Lacibacter luteus]|nr:nuclear transport factor 2 family protein [Lacibacter luteus]
MKQFLFLLLLFVTTVATAQKTKEESATEKFVLKLHETKFRWMINKKLDSLSTILDERVQYVHSNGWMETKKEIIDDLRSGKLVMNNVTVTEASARVYKGFVIVNGKGVFNVVLEGKKVDINLLYTEVYAKRQNGWLLVSRHANKLP